MSALLTTLCLVGIAGATLTVSAVGFASAAPPQAISLLARWQSFPASSARANTRIALDVAGRLAFVFSAASRTTPGRVQVWDLDTRVSASPIVQLPVDFPILGTTPIVIDEAHHSAYIAAAPSGTSAPSIARIAYRSHTVTTTTMSSHFPASYQLMGLSVDLVHGLALALAQPGGCVPSASGCFGSGTTGLGLVQADEWSLDALDRGSVTSPWSSPLEVPSSCGQLMTYKFASGALLSPDGSALYFACRSGGALGPDAAGSHPPAELSGAATLTLAKAAQHLPGALELHPVTGYFPQGDSLAVPGTGRLLLTSLGAPSPSMKVFDTRHGHYAGNVGFPSFNVGGVGVNDQTGTTYYTAAGEGLTSIDTSALPVGQGVSSPQFQGVLGWDLPAFAVDSRTRHIFVITSVDPGNATSRPYIAVLADSSPSTVTDTPVAFGGVDRPEVRGVTESSRIAAAAAKGVDYRLVGGTAALFRNVTLEDAHLPVSPRAGTRHLQLAVAQGVNLTNDQASALVTTEQQDDATTDDTNVSNPSPSPSPGTSPVLPDRFGTRAADPVLCLSFGGARQDSSGDNAQVTCDLNKPEVTAHVRASVPQVLITSQGGTLPAPVQVKSAESSISVHRAGVGPVVSHIETEADGIDILGIVQIGRVASISDVFAHGRSGSASVKRTIAISDVVVNGVPVCDAQCSVTALTSTINDALGGRGRVDFPSPAIIAAPNGRQAALRDSDYGHVEGVILNDVPSDDVTVPAMAITVYADGISTSRSIVSLAAQSSEELYRIFAVGSGPSWGSTAPPQPVPSVSLPSVGPLASGTPTSSSPQAVAFVGPTTSSTGLLQAIRRGLHVILRSPGQIAGVALLWLLLSIPCYLSARRRLLIDLPHLTAVQGEAP